MPDPLRLSDFTPQLNTVFQLELAEETLHFTLAEAADLGFGADDAGQRRAFSLLFRHERTDAYLPQGMYTVQHDTLGELLLFLVPLGPRSDGMYYESVFT